MKKKKNNRWRARRSLPVRAQALMVAVGALAVGLGLWLDDAGVAALSRRPAVPLRISEIQSRNTATLSLPSGDMPAWVEIENAGDAPLSLHGVGLALENKPNKIFVFPDIRLDAGAFVLVYCDKLGSASLAGEQHAPFSLSASGSELFLFDASQNLLDRVQVPALKADEAWCRGADDEWALTHTPTPGAVNTLAPNRARESGAVRLNEVMAANACACFDEDGDAPDYCELANTSGAPVDLAGWYLSDTAETLRKWELPPVSLAPGGLMTVHCSGKDRREDPAHLHTGFKLSAGETLYLSNPAGEIVSSVTLPELEKGVAWSLENGVWTDRLPPTPGQVNDWEGVAAYDAVRRAQLGGGLILSELMAVPQDEDYDWVELYNGLEAPVDLSGFGLSDRAGKPRKWQFPQGTQIPAKGYLGVFLTGAEKSYRGEFLSAPFALSGDGGYTITLSDASGTVLDAISVPPQASGVSYGRSDLGVCGFFARGTPLAANGDDAMLGVADVPGYSVTGGLFEAGDRLEVALTAPEGARIHYTLDCSDPTESSPLYNGEPIPVRATTILRTRVYQDGWLPSRMDTQSYLFDVGAARQAPYVVSLVSDPEGLYSSATGIMVKGPNATDKFPYGDYGKGANFWMDWEREAHVELFTGAGETAISQECGIKLHGRNTRAYELKSFKVMAKSQYGDNRFRYPIFRDRPYDEYEAFILRYSGQDYKYTFMRDAVLTALAADTSVMYMEAEECVVYLNGEYYSAMYIRENVSPFSVSRREGWAAGDVDDVDLVKSVQEVKQGSNASYQALTDWLDANDPTTDEAYRIIDAAVDVDNFIEYAVLQVVLGTPDSVNVKRYRNPNGDGKWRWVLYDVDRAMRENIDGFSVMAKGTNGRLFRACMKNPTLRQKFLDELNRALAGYLSSQRMYDDVQDQFERIQPLLPDYLAKMKVSKQDYRGAMTSLVRMIGRRPRQVLSRCQRYLGLSDDQMYAQFADAVAAVEAYEAQGDMPAFRNAEG